MLVEEGQSFKLQFTATAVSHSLLLILDRDAFLSLAKLYPEVSTALKAELHETPSTEADSWVMKTSGIGVPASSFANGNMAKADSIHEQDSGGNTGKDVDSVLTKPISPTKEAKKFVV
jgi:hypothetical protein